MLPFSSLMCRAMTSWGGFIIDNEAGAARSLISRKGGRRPCEPLVRCHDSKAPDSMMNDGLFL
jgi:hypothetical protein